MLVSLPPRLRGLFIFSILWIALGFSATAMAAGWQANGMVVNGANAPRVVAAMDALFDSRVTRNAPVRVVLRMNLADGNAPDTHTFVIMFDSAAKREAWTNKLYDDAAWAAFMQTMSEASESQGTTMRGVLLYSSGDVNDTDEVWVNHYLTVEEPAVLLNAMRAYNATDAGKASPGQVHLSAVVAGGTAGPSHIVSVGYASEAEWEAEMARDRGPAWQNLMDTMGAVSEYHGATMQRDIKAWGDVSVSDIAVTGGR